MKGYGNNFASFGKGRAQHSGDNGILQIPRDAVPDWGCGCGFQNWGTRSKCLKCGRAAPFNIQGKQQRAVADRRNNPPRQVTPNILAAKDREIESLRKQLQSRSQQSTSESPHGASEPSDDPHKARVDTLQAILDSIPISTDTFVVMHRKQASPS